MHGELPINPQKILLKVSTIQKEVASILEDEIELFVSNLSSDIAEIVTYLFRQGGKRLRPAFFVFIASQIDKSINVGPYALTIELIHNMSLYHDDVIDQAKERRGAPTVHEYYDVATAIVGGDILHSQIHRHLLVSANDNRIEVNSMVKFLEELLDIEIIIGSAVLKEMRMASSPLIPSLEETMDIAANKTAPLFGFSAKAAALVCNRKDIAELLYNFGFEFGNAFQLLDDLLDYFATEKDLGGDLREGKKTPLISLIYKNNPDLVNNILGNEDIKKNELHAFIRASKDQFYEIIDMITKHLQRALDLIDTVEINSEINILFNLINLKIMEIKSQLEII